MTTQTKNSKQVLKLFYILHVVKSVTSRQWECVRLIVEHFSGVTVLEKKWNDAFKEKYPESYPLDLSQIKTWSTYDKCVDLIFTIEKGKLHCEACIYDGDNLNGHRTNLKFTAKMIMPDEFILQLEGLIESYFDYHVEDLYDQHLEKQKKIWLQDTKYLILNRGL